MRKEVCLAYALAVEQNTPSKCNVDIIQMSTLFSEFSLVFFNCLSCDNIFC